MPSDELPPGYNVGGFEVIEMIGEGAMGQVYIANQVSMNRKVALKIIKPEITSNEENISDFVREIRLLASFNHPNIVLAIEAGKQGNLYFLAMEYIEGNSLDDYLVEGEIFTEQQSLAIIGKVAQALESAWDEHQLIHCDIKPANIMLDRKNNPKLMDLGISKCSGEQSTELQIVGTPFFMSPEQARGHTLDFRSDIFSTGASLYNILTGQFPFPGENLHDPMAVIQAVKHDDINTAELKERGISKSTAMLILKMCSKSQDERHSSWSECISEINIILEKFSNKEKEISDPPKKQMKVSQGAIRRKNYEKKKSYIPLILIGLLVLGIYLSYKHNLIGILQDKVEGQQKINSEEESPKKQSNPDTDTKGSKNPTDQNRE